MESSDQDFEEIEVPESNSQESEVKIGNPENSSRKQDETIENIAASQAEILNLEAPSTLDEDEAEESEGLPRWKPAPDKLLQALVFANTEFITYKTIKEIMGEDWDVPKLRQLTKTINQRLVENEEPFEIMEISGALRFRTLTQYYPWVKKLFKDNTSRRLSQASLETLAIVAYKQPVTKAEVEAIRGVSVDGNMKTLLEKKLIDISGKAESVGSPFTYSTTKEFLKYFGINKVPDDLPRLSELEDLIHAQALVPQITRDGQVQSMEQGEPELEPDPNQISMDIEA